MKCETKLSHQNIFYSQDDPLAQLVEHLTFNQGVPSSNLGWVTIYGALVKRLRHCPFTAVSWVRIPYASPLRAISSAGRAPALQAGCRRFDPVIAHQNNIWPGSLVG